MHALTLCLAILFLAGSVSCFTKAELDAVTKTVSVILDDNPLVQALPNEARCRDNVKSFFLGALPVVLPKINDNDLATALTTIAVIDGNLVTLNGREINAVVEGSTDLTPEACVPLCKLTKEECGCDDTVWKNLVILTGNDEDVAAELINTFVDSCLATFPSMAFTSNLEDREMCMEGHSTADFVCEV